MSRTRGLPFAVFLLLLAHLALGALRLLPATLHRAQDGLRDADLTVDQARAEAFGDAWVAAIDAVRAQVPADGAYLLLRDAAAPEGAEHWPRFELAPRRAFYLGTTGEPPAAARLRRLPADLRWVVVACPPYEPPRLLPRWRLRAELEAGRVPGCR